MDPGFRRGDIERLEPSVTLYAIFDPQPGRLDLPAAVPEKLSWFAAILPPVFLGLHRLWLELAAWLLGFAVLVVASIVLGGAAAITLYLLGAIWLGLAAPDLIRRALLRRGWTARGERVADSADMAQLEAIR